MVLTFSGAMINAGKKKASPRRIPFAAIRGVEVKKPGATSGYLRFILASSDIDAKFNKLRDLDTLVVYAGPNYTAALSALEALRDRVGEDVYFAGAEPTAGPSVTPASARPGGQRDGRKERLAQEASAGGARPDIAEAARRMGWTFGGKREIRLLHEHVNTNEAVGYIAQGTYGEHQGITVLTDQRLLFVFHGWVNQLIEDFPLDRITSVSSKSGFGTGTLIVHTGGARAEISSIANRDLKYFVDALRGKVAGSSGNTGVTPEGESEGVIEQIREAR